MSISGPAHGASTRLPALLIPLLAASGFAGLAYEVVWTRMLAAALGTEILAVVGVVTGFFAGLALGALALDAPIRRARSARRAYAGLEAAVAVWAVASVWLIPWLCRALPPWLGPRPDPLLLWAAGFVLPAVVLLPATAAIGGTLVALERLTAGLCGRTRITPWVYGANTAGAMAGALASLFALLPQFGVSGTLLGLVAVNLACALGALALGRRADATPASTGAERATGTPLTSALLATGFLGIAFEVLVVRLASQMLQNTIHTFAVLLAAYLLGTALGGFAWQKAGRRIGSPSLFAATASACLATVAIAPYAPSIAAWTGPPDSLMAEAAVALALFLLPSAAMGAVFAGLAQEVRDRRGSLGRAVGLNALGAAAAPPVAALAFVPGIGARSALILVAFGYALLGGGCLRQWATRAAAPAMAAAVLWLAPAPPLVRVPPGGVLLEAREGASATASVVEDAGGVRYLEVNGHFRMGGTDSLRSDWRQAHLPLLLHPAPRRALFLGVGTGATLAGAAALPDLDATGVELLPEVVGLLPWFAERDAPPLPPVVAADARRFVAAADGRYDAIVADLFHPALDGTGALYGAEHFAAVKRRLAPGGLFCQWLPLYQLDGASLRAIIRTFLDVFPDGSAWLAHFSLQTPMLALVGSDGPVAPDTDALARRMADPLYRAALRRTGLLAPMDVLGLHVGEAASLRDFGGAGPRNTDDTPIVALDGRGNVRAMQARPATLLLSVLGEVKPDPSALVVRGLDRELAGRLEAYREARNRFLAAGAAVPDGARGRILVEAAVPGLLEAIRSSAEFEPAYAPLMAMAEALLATDRDAGLRLLRAVDQAAPLRPEARRLLARVAAP